MKIRNQLRVYSKVIIISNIIPIFKIKQYILMVFAKICSFDYLILV